MASRPLIEIDGVYDPDFKCQLLLRITNRTDHQIKIEDVQVTRPRGVLITATQRMNELGLWPEWVSYEPVIGPDIWLGCRTEKLNHHIIEISAIVPNRSRTLRVRVGFQHRSGSESRTSIRQDVILRDVCTILELHRSLLHKDE